MPVVEAVRDVAIALGAAVVACGLAVVASVILPDSTSAGDSSPSPTLTAGVDLDAKPVPSPHVTALAPSQSPSASDATPAVTPPSADPPAPPAPPPPRERTRSAFYDMEGMALRASTTGTLTMSVQGGIWLVPGGTASCVTVMGGVSWPMGDPYIGEGWVEDLGYHVFMVWGDVTLEPADYPFTITCTTSDGVVWSGSGTAMTDEFIGFNG